MTTLAAAPKEVEFIRIPNVPTHAQDTSDRMAELVNQTLSNAEQIRLINLSLHGLLKERGLTDLAYLAWAAYLIASDSCDAMGEAVGMEQLLDAAGQN